VILDSLDCRLPIFRFSASHSGWVDIEWGDALLRAVSGRTESTTDGGEDTEVVTISRAEKNGTLTRKSNYFEARFAFYPTMEGVCSALVQAQNKHRHA
jgi:hypothetical protein